MPGHEGPRCHRLRTEQAPRRRGSRSRRSQGRRGARAARCDGHLPHRRLHAVGRRSRGPLPRDLRPRGRGHRRRRRPGRDVTRQGRPRHPALHARVPGVQIVPQPEDQPVHGDPRHAGQGPHARRHEPLLHRRQEGAPLHGLLDVLELHRAAGDRAREDPPRRAVREGLLHRLRRHDGRRRRDQHREGRARRERRGVRPRRHRPQRRAGCTHRRRRHDHRRRHQPGPRGARAQARHDPLREPEGGGQAISSHTSSS